MKIWCVDYAGLSYNTHSRLFFSKDEAQNLYDSLYAGGYRKMYQVEDIWGWCGRHFEQVILEVLSSRDNGDDFIYICGLTHELKEAAKHCGIGQFSVDAFWNEDEKFILSVAWVNDGDLFHRTYNFNALDDRYEYPTIIERRSKWQKEN